MSYVIKRYSNRKLYDIQTSRFVTLDELQEMIQAGKEIRVVDSDTGEDLTSLTLAQILLESERNHRATLPAMLFHQIIKHGEAWQDLVQRSVRAGLEGAATGQQEADRLFREWVSGVANPTKESQAADPKTQKASGEPSHDLRDEVASLKKRLQALEQKSSKKRKK